MAFILKKTDDTPYVRLEKGHIEIKGNSLPENVLHFYNPIVKWIKEYVDDPPNKTLIKLFLTYTNSCSIKYINDLLKLLESGHHKGGNMNIEWHYEEGDEENLEIGKDLETLIDIPFSFVSLESDIQTRRRVKVQNIKSGKVGEISEMYWETIKRNGHEREFKLIEYC